MWGGAQRPGGRDEGREEQGREQEKYYEGDTKGYGENKQPVDGEEDNEVWDEEKT